MLDRDATERVTGSDRVRRPRGGTTRRRTRRPTGTSTSSATSSATVAAGPRDPQPLARHDQAVRAQVVGIQQRGEGDPVARRDPAQPVARFDRVCRPTGSARRTAAATDTAATSAGRAGDGQLLARHDQTGGRETVRGEQGVQRDPMSGGDLAQPITRPHGVPRPAGSARRAAAGSRNHETLTRQDQAVDRQVVGP